MGAMPQPSQQRQLDRFERVLREVGGRPLAGACTSVELPPVASGARSGEGLVARMDIEAGYTCGCGNESRVEIPYEPDPSNPAPKHGGRCIVCAICDAGTRMPRFQETL